MPQINEYPESTSPNSSWFVVVDDGTGCYKKVKLSNLPGGGAPTSSTSTTTSTTTTPSGPTTTTSTTTVIGTTSTTTTIAYDPDATAFFAAAGITDTTTKLAVNTMVLNMKSTGLWTKMRALYPFVGGTSLSNSINLKNTATFAITFNGGGWTYNSNGIKGNGSTSYADTGFNPNAQTMGYDMAYGVYSREDLVTSPGTVYTCIGSYDTSPAPSADYLSFEGIGGNKAVTGYITGVGATVAYSPAADLKRLFVISRTSSTSLTLYKEATQVDTVATLTAVAHPNYNMYISAANNLNVSTYYSPVNFAFAFISTGLTSGDLIDLNSIVNNFQTALGRNV